MTSTQRSAGLSRSSFSILAKEPLYTTCHSLHQRVEPVEGNQSSLPAPSVLFPPHLSASILSLGCCISRCCLICRHQSINQSQQTIHSFEKKKKKKKVLRYSRAYYIPQHNRLAGRPTGKKKSEKAAESTNTHPRAGGVGDLHHVPRYRQRTHSHTPSRSRISQPSARSLVGSRGYPSCDLTQFGAHVDVWVQSCRW